MLGGWVWVRYRIGGIGNVSTDGRDSTVVLTNEFRPNCGSQPPFPVAQHHALGAADGKGMSADLEGVTMVTRHTRSP